MISRAAQRYSVLLCWFGSMSKSHDFRDFGSQTAARFCMGLAVLYLLLLSVGVPPARAQTPKPINPAQTSPAPKTTSKPLTVPSTADRQLPTIRAIRFEGLQLVNPAEIRFLLRSQAGRKLNPEYITQDIKAVYGLKAFQHVQVLVEELTQKEINLIYVFTERPRIGALVIEGVHTLNQESIDAAITIKEGQFFSKNTLENNLESLRNAYRVKSIYDTRIRYQLSRHTKNSFKVLIQVTEAEPLRLTQIRTHNNRAFTQLQILRFFESSAIDCFNWVNDTGMYHEERINHDLRIISAEYIKRGYIRLFIEKPAVRFIRGRAFSKVLVDLHFVEGAQYFVRKIEVVGEVEGDSRALTDFLGLKSGDIYNPLQQNRDIAALRAFFQDRGYAFAQVLPQVNIDDKTKQVDVVLNVKRGEKTYIGRILFHGNTSTRDYVLRREMLISEDGLYHGTKLRQSQNNLLRLGYFKPSLSVDNTPAWPSNVLDINVRMEESQTGTAQAQIGYNKSSGTILSFSVSKGNFLGRGQTIRTSVEWAQRDVRQRVSFDFIEPRLYGSKFSSNSSISFSQSEDNIELERGDIEEVFLSEGIGVPIFGPLRANFSLSWLQRTYANDDDESIILPTASSSLAYNTVNHPVFPSSGISISFVGAQTGGKILGGSTEYRRYTFRARKFISLNKAGTVVTMLRARLGWLDSVGNHLIPPEERYRIGGSSSLRGFDRFEVGGAFGLRQFKLNSIDTVAVDALGRPIFAGNTSIDRRTLGLPQTSIDQLRSGGIARRIFNAELLFPLTGSTLRGVLFYDSGQVVSESEQYTILKQEKPGPFDLLHAAGLGIRFITPLGVLRFEYGVKLNPEKEEDKSSFDFNVSSLF